MQDNAMHMTQRDALEVGAALVRQALAARQAATGTAAGAQQAATAGTGTQANPVLTHVLRRPPQLSPQEKAAQAVAEALETARRISVQLNFDTDGDAEMQQEQQETADAPRQQPHEGAGGGEDGPGCADGRARPQMKDVGVACDVQPERAKTRDVAACRLLCRGTSYPTLPPKMRIRIRRVGRRIKLIIPSMAR